MNALPADLANPGLLSRFTRDVILGLYRREGWKVFNHAPGIRKAVMIAAPHTSNWDFVHFLGATRELGITPRFMGKASLFRWPMRRFMFEMGGVPVDRSQKRDMVSQMADQFGTHDDFMLTIAVEGTRGKGSGKWKTGFYHIAQKAGVPIIPASMDYAKKEAGLHTPVYPTGDYRADLEQILASYKGVTPAHSDRTLVGKAGVDAFL